jgi:hypothetical protein
MTLQELIKLKGPVIQKYWECLGNLDVLGGFDGCGAVYLEPTEDCRCCGMLCYEFTYYHGNATNYNPILKLKGN